MSATICGPFQPSVLVYNRIGKAGSSTMIHQLRGLSARNNFTFSQPFPYHDHKALRTSIFSSVSNQSATVICNHFNFPELTYGDELKYINIMRDPVQRYISEYYYMRSSKRGKQAEKFIERWGNYTIDECLGRNETCLSGKSNVQIEYLCGKENGACDRMSDAEKFITALDNWKRHYFLGIMENMIQTIELLEILFPRFFKGANSTVVQVKNPTKYQQPSHSSIKILEAMNYHDILFYREVKAHFQFLVSKCLAI